MINVIAIVSIYHLLSKAWLTIMEKQQNTDYSAVIEKLMLVKCDEMLYLVENGIIYCHLENLCKCQKKWNGIMGDIVNVTFLWTGVMELFFPKYWKKYLLLEQDWRCKKVMLVGQQCNLSLVQSLTKKHRIPSGSWVLLFFNFFTTLRIIWSNKGSKFMCEHK